MDRALDWTTVTIGMATHKHKCTSSITAPALEVGFGGASLWGCWAAHKPLADEIAARVIVLRQGDAVAAMAVGDLCTLTPEVALRLRGTIAAALSTPAGNVGVFVTQNHATSSDMRTFDLAKLEARFLDAVRAAAATVVPVEAASVAVRPDPPLNTCRRARLEGYGAFTFYFGYSLTDGRPECNHLLRLALKGFAEGQPYAVRSCDLEHGNLADYQATASREPVPDQVFLPPAADDLLQGVFFRSMEGRPVGAILRFAAHPNTASPWQGEWSSGDYPAYARRHLEKAFGGAALFLGGPCGDQSCVFGVREIETSRRIGARLAHLALGALDDAEWRRAPRLRVASPEVGLRVRSDYVASREEGTKGLDDLTVRIEAAAAAGAPLAEIKRLSDRYEALTYQVKGSHRKWTGLDLIGGGGREIRHPLFVLRFGDVAVVGLPGEPFGGVSVRLREETLKDGLIVAEGGNGYLSYIPTRAEFPLGGYGPNASILGPDAEDTLVRAVKQALAGNPAPCVA